MIRINYSYSHDYKKFFDNAPRLFEDFKNRASKRTLEMWHKRAFERAPYDKGTLSREIKHLYNQHILAAGQFLSAPYAHIQDVGGRAGRGGSVYIKPKHYFYKMADDSAPEVERIYEEELEKTIS